MNSNMWEGLGGPVKMDQPELSDIDPTLAACCRREVSEDEPRWAECFDCIILTCFSILML